MKEEKRRGENKGEEKGSLDPRHFWPREGLGNNLAWKCLAGMPRLLNPANFIFRSSTRLVRYYSNFQNFYTLPYITSCH